MLVDKYRRRAVECLRIAESLPDTLNRALLIDMAQSWLLLAQQAYRRHNYLRDACSAQRSQQAGRGPTATANPGHERGIGGRSFFLVVPERPN
jgi:hypothetical protein